MMTPRHSRVIVFGPTGHVGSATALEASQRGAHVTLAMRDPSKPVPGITSSDSTFTRLKADLTDPSSVTAVVGESKATAAFIYHVQSQDGLRASLSAMKEAGIQHVVFLSTFSIQRDVELASIPPEDLIPYIHAQIELNLSQLGFSYTAIRPAQFASNQFMMSLDQSTTPWSAHVFKGDALGDAIVPGDIGKVAASVLVSPPPTEELPSDRAIYLCGPELTTTDEKWDVIKKVHAEQNIDVKHVGANEFSAYLKGKGLPPPLVDYLVSQLGGIHGDGSMYKAIPYDEYSRNVKKYSGYEPTRFEEFVRGYQLE